MILKGKAWLFVIFHVDTDVIIPARYLTTSDGEKLAPHCMEILVPEFYKKVAPGDIIIAGQNFGCGSSREHAPIAIKSLRHRAIVAASFARIFYRNAINIGLPILEVEDILRDTKQGDELEINTDLGAIVNLSNGKAYQSPPFPPFIEEIIAAGGLMRYIAGREK